MHAASVRVVIGLAVLLLLPVAQHRKTFNMHRATSHAKPRRLCHDSYGATGNTDGTEQWRRYDVARRTP